MYSLQRLFAFWHPHKCLTMFSSCQSCDSTAVVNVKYISDRQENTRWTRTGSQADRAKPHVPPGELEGRGGRGAADRIFSDINETVFSFYSEITKQIHLELTHWFLFRWPTTKAIGYNSAGINVRWRNWMFLRDLFRLQAVIRQPRLTFTLWAHNHSQQSPLRKPPPPLKWNAQKTWTFKWNQGTCLSRQSVWWHAFRSCLQRVLNVVKCKWLDARRPKWEARFYMGQRQEDYRSEINGGREEGEIPPRIV